jgi:hypothetical protein
METKTINLRDVPEDLVRRAKTYAAWRGLSLKDFILDAMRQALETSEMGAVSLFVQPRLKEKRKRRKGS